MPRPSLKIEWDAHEHEYKERSPDWFWTVGILTVAIAIAAIIFGNAIFAILILIGAFSLTLFVNKEPDIVHISMDEKGIRKDNVLYPYYSLASFWVDEEHSFKKILLRSEKTLMPLIIIPLGDTDPEKIRRVLGRILPEEYHDLHLAEKFLEYLGF